MSLASHVTRFAISMGWPIRPMGRDRATLGMSAMPDLSIMSVTTRPGATALTRMPYCAYSIAADRVREMTAALDAE